MFNVGYQEMIFIGVLALVVLGPNRLPEFFRTIGKVLATVRRTADDLRREVDRAELKREGLDRFIREAESAPSILDITPRPRPLDQPEEEKYRGK